MNNYIGHPTQLFGVEEHRLVGGKGDGLRLFEVNNGRGLMFTISADRCGDISRLYFDGKNLGFFAPCGTARGTHAPGSGCRSRGSDRPTLPLTSTWSGPETVAQSGRERCCAVQLDSVRPKRPSCFTAERGSGRAPRGRRRPT